MNIRTIKVSYLARLGLPNYSHVEVGVELSGELEPEVEHDSQAEASQLLELARELVAIELHPLEQQKQAAEPRVTRTVASEAQRQGITPRSAAPTAAAAHVNPRTRPAGRPKAPPILTAADDIPEFRYTDKDELQINCPAHGWSFAKVWPNDSSPTGKVAKCGRKEASSPTGWCAEPLVAWDGD